MTLKNNLQYAHMQIENEFLHFENFILHSELSSAMIGKIISVGDKCRCGKGESTS